MQRQFGHVGHAADVCSDVAAVTDVLSQLQFCFTDNLVACTKLPRSAGWPNFLCTIFGSAARMFLDSSVGSYASEVNGRSRCLKSTACEINYVEIFTKNWGLS